MYTDSPETVRMLSKGDIIYISSFVNLQTIYVRCINDGTDKFKSFLENFSSCCALSKCMHTYLLLYKYIFVLLGFYISFFNYYL